VAVLCPSGDDCEARCEGEAGGCAWLGEYGAGQGRVRGYGMQRTEDGIEQDRTESERIGGGDATHHEKARLEGT